jgi:hypothetical protein
LSACDSLGSFRVEILTTILAESTFLWSLILTIAPVTIVVFSSGKPTVTARLVCPAAAKAKRPTTIRAEALARFFDVEVQHTQAATNIKAV